MPVGGKASRQVAETFERGLGDHSWPFPRGRLSEPRSLSSAPSSAAHQGRRSLGRKRSFGDLAVHLEDDFAGDRISDAKVTAEVFQHLAAAIEGLDHLRPGRDDRVHAVPLADEAEVALAGLDDGDRPHSSEGVAVDGAVRLEVVRVPPGFTRMRTTL